MFNCYQNIKFLNFIIWRKIQHLYIQCLQEIRNKSFILSPKSSNLVRETYYGQNILSQIYNPNHWRMYGLSFKGERKAFPRRWLVKAQEGAVLGMEATYTDHRAWTKRIRSPPALEHVEPEGVKVTGRDESGKRSRALILKCFVGQAKEFRFYLKTKGSH